MPFPTQQAAQRHQAAQTARGPSERLVLAGASVAALWVAVWLALQLAEAAGWSLPL